MRILIFFIVVSSIFYSCQTPKENVDMIITNATIYCVDPGFTKANTLVINNGEIIAVGAGELLGRYNSKTIIDVKGKFVYPGLYDAHCHFYGYSMNLREVDLKGTKSFDEIIERIEKYKETFNSEWIVGRGWDQNKWEVKEFPDNRKLNELFPHKPVFLRRVDGHAAVANKKALEIAGISAKTEVNGGKVETKNGELTGILIDNAMELVREKVPQLKDEEQMKYLEQGAKNCFKVGLTSVVDAGLEYEKIILIDSMQKEGRLKMQMYAMLAPTKENFERIMHKGVLKTDYLHVQSIKLYADGALGSRGACMIEPYSDDPGNYGLMVTSSDEMKQFCLEADEYGYQVCTHAIGDSANRTVLQVYGDVLKEKNDKRWRIEHSQVIHPDDFKFFGQYSIIPAINTTHATSDMTWADERLGDKRIKYAYAYKKLLAENGWLCNGSDFPVEDINPLYGFYAAVARKDLKGYPANGFQPENALTREQALKAMTIWAAKSAFQENEKGSIEPGKDADFTILNKDIMTIPENEIPHVQVLKTIVRGEVVYSAK